MTYQKQTKEIAEVTWFKQGSDIKTSCSFSLHVELFEKEAQVLPEAFLSGVYFPFVPAWRFSVHYDLSQTPQYDIHVRLIINYKWIDSVKDNCPF